GQTFVLCRKQAKEDRLVSQTPPCPYCGASSFRFRDERWLVCTACEREFDLQRDLCRRCGWINQAEARYCTHCDAPLPRDPVDRLIAERSKDQRAWRRLYGELGLQGKQGDIHASKERMQAFLAEDRARREAQAHARAAQRVREQRTLIVAGVIAAILIALLLALALLGPLSDLLSPVSALPRAALPGEWDVLGGICDTCRTALG
ncbi:MAG: hypothetical protein JXA09_17115, partial [Anaerolineae bacterium]|nr:hypothetical protein [Anaerolineae bacterium]